MSVTERGHLSIGEVLTLLQGEFPDVTISKIRFLESQGLIDPERTPSGYRKFYEADIARLRWILVQQRDHFLPLKVIKDRLDGADPDELAAAAPLANGSATPSLFDAPGPLDEADGVPVAAAQAELPPGLAAPPDVPVAQADALLGADGSSLDGSALQGVPALPADALAAGRAFDDTPEPVDGTLVEPVDGTPVLDVASEGSPSHDAPAPATGTPAGVTGDDAEPDPPDAAQEDHVAGNDDAAPFEDEPTGEQAAVDPEAGPPAPERGSGRRTGSGSAGSGSSSGGSGAGGGRSRGTAAGGRSGSARSSGRRRRASADVSSASFTIDELAAACDTTVAAVEDLERFGLVTSRPVSGGRRYGDDALVVTKLACRFAEYGIEPRHLRMFRVAVERELALYEQVVTPIARGRVDGGEIRASEIWAELDGLGADLRDALFHRGQG